MIYRRAIWRAAIVCGSSIIIASAAATALFFPWDLDARGDQSAMAREFYERVYRPGQASRGVSISASFPPLSDIEQFYVEAERQGAVQSRVQEVVKDFVQRFALRDKKVLDVGAGSGLLQDLVTDYTGLDISSTARRFFRKPFIEASATDMPFPDNTFDGLWSVWVLEHIPNPERALLEMRRVVKPGGYLLLWPALDVSRYAAQGYRVRPYSDFDWRGKLVWATVPLVESTIFHSLQYHQILALRSFAVRLATGPSRLHFIRLTPNYDQYWESDSDACTSLSAHELYLWFMTRGDRCLNCPSEIRLVLRHPRPYLIIQTVKR